jgi:hypothetical protein
MFLMMNTLVLPYLVDDDLGSHYDQGSLVTVLTKISDVNQESRRKRNCSDISGSSLVKAYLGKKKK